MKTKYHQDEFTPRLDELARRCGIKLRPLKHFVDGTVGLYVQNPNEEAERMGACGEYGKEFCEALAGVRWRTGDSAYGYSTSPLYHKNGWAYVVSSDLVEALDRLGI